MPNVFQLSFTCSLYVTIHVHSGIVRSGDQYHSRTVEQCVGVNVGAWQKVLQITYGAH